MNIVFEIIIGLIQHLKFKTCRPNDMIIIIIKNIGLILFLCKVLDQVKNFVLDH